MCAKVTGPLYSMSASGKIADAMVFFDWKGINVVRQFVVPSNPKTGDQGDQRLIMGGSGRAASAIKKTSEFAASLVDLDLVPAGQTKQSFIVKKLIDTYLYSLVKYEEEVTAFGSHTAHADFTSSAELIGLADFDISYKGTSSAYSAGLMLYLLAQLAIALGFTGAPYTTALASWTATEITAFVADLAAAV